MIHQNEPDLHGDNSEWSSNYVLYITTIAFLMGFVILAATLGNLLVIITIVMHRNLCIAANYFIVSLAVADMLVAISVMPFNASLQLTGHWIFSSFMCDLWNSLDVYFCTASILHLCCISVDRYYAIVTPFEYSSKMNRKIVVLMLINIWFAPGVIAFVPIFTGWYTTNEHALFHQHHPEVCDFKVNKVYAIISSSVSFWIPCTIMVFTYIMIFIQANRHERQMHLHLESAYYRLSGTKNDDETRFSQETRSASQESSLPRSSQTDRRSTGKLKREYRAARTLGVIMGAFILCWLPFFLWYVSTTLCGAACPSSDFVVSLLFWIGYTNSALNPVIYVYFNRDLRKAMKHTLQQLCCFSVERISQNFDFPRAQIMANPISSSF